MRRAAVAPDVGVPAVLVGEAAEERGARHGAGDVRDTVGAAAGRVWKRRNFDYCAGHYYPYNAVQDKIFFLLQLWMNPLLLDGTESGMFIWKRSHLSQEKRDRGFTSGYISLEISISIESTGHEG